MNAAHPVQKLYVPETCGVCSLAAVTAFHADRGCGRTYHRNRFPAGSESAACRGQDCEAGAIRTRRIHRYHHGTRPQMKRACLSETGTPVARQVTQGLEAQGWNVRLRTEGPAPDVRGAFLEDAGSRLGWTGEADWDRKSGVVGKRVAG